MKMADLRAKATAAYCDASVYGGISAILRHLAITHSWTSYNMRQNWTWLDNMIALHPSVFENNKPLLTFHREGAIYFCAKDHGKDAAMLLKLQIA